MSARATMASSGLGTPETYLNPQEAQALAQPPRLGTHFYPGVIDPELNEFGLHGSWTASAQAVSPAAAGTSITGRFQASHVYLVMTSSGNTPRSVRVLVDGHPVSAAEAGTDVAHATVTVRGQRLYSLVALPSAERHTITLDVPVGVSAYDFTFG
jgi:hypothetical protein